MSDARKIKVKIETEVELMAKAFAYMPDDEQAKFLAVAYREMATYNSYGKSALGSIGRESQMYYIGTRFKDEPDARSFVEELHEMTREAAPIDGFVLDMEGGIPSPGQAAEIRAWLDEKCGPRLVQHGSDVAAVPAGSWEDEQLRKCAGDKQTAMQVQLGAAEIRTKNYLAQSAKAAGMRPFVVKHAPVDRCPDCQGTGEVALFNSVEPCPRGCKS